MDEEKKEHYYLQKGWLEPAHALEADQRCP